MLDGGVGLRLWLGLVRGGGEDVQWGWGYIRWWDGGGRGGEQKGEGCG